MDFFRKSDIHKGNFPSNYSKNPQILVRIFSIPEKFLQDFQFFWRSSVRNSSRNSIKDNSRYSFKGLSRDSPRNLPEDASKNSSRRCCFGTIKRFFQKFVQMFLQAFLQMFPRDSFWNFSGSPTKNHWKIIGEMS